jgi:hypothetical protein
MTWIGSLTYAGSGVKISLIFWFLDFNLINQRQRNGSQIKSIKSNQIKSNQIKSNQIKSEIRNQKSETILFGIVLADNIRFQAMLVLTSQLAL